MSFCCPLVTETLLITSYLGGRSTSLGSDISVIDIGGRIVRCSIIVMLQGLVVANVGFGNSVVVLRRGWVVALLVSVHRRDVGCRISMCVLSTSLLAMSDEVFKILYGRHVGHGAMTGRFKKVDVTFSLLGVVDQSLSARRKENGAAKREGARRMMVVVEDGNDGQVKEIDDAK